MGVEALTFFELDYNLEAAIENELYNFWFFYAAVYLNYYDFFASLTRFTSATVRPIIEIGTKIIYFQFYFL